MECRDCAHHETLEEESQSGLAAGETPVEETDAWDDEPDNEAAEDEVRVVVFETNVLRIYVDEEGIPAAGAGCVEYGLHEDVSCE